MYSGTALLLIPAVIGYTEAIKNQFPVVKGIVPLVTIVMSFLLYAGFIYLPQDLFMTIYGAGASMGLYTGAKIIGGNN